MSSGDLLLHDIQEYLISVTTDNFLYDLSEFWFYMSTFFVACFFWWLAIVLLSSASSSSSNASESHTAEAFHSNLLRRLIRPVETAVGSPFRSLIGTANTVSKTATPKARTSSGSAKDSPYQSKNSDHSSLTLSLEVAFNDLAPPFSMDEVTPEELSAFVASPDITHFCFLIHGHRGLSKDLAYMQTVMQRWATVEKKKQQRRHQIGGALVDSNCGDDLSKHPEAEGLSDPSMLYERGDRKMHDLVVHSAVCNEGKTTDGIENGGDRLVDEMRQVIDFEMKRRHPELAAGDSNVSTARNGDEKENSDSRLSNVVQESVNQSDVPKDTLYDISISIMGNSLGGLFGRYAIAKLVERHCIRKEDDSGTSGKEPTWILDGKYRIHLNIFCTTATPHLGVSGHTWVRIPRSAEIGFAHAMGQSGKDLFRVNDLLHTMATSQAFLRPLGAFRKRIAYANCYGTDFVVPVGTAAFLSEKSTYPHHFLEEEDYVVDENGMVIAALRTPRHDGSNDGNELEDSSDELHQMSSSLDKLGWKKVLVDVRKELPCVELPKSMRTRRLPTQTRLGSNEGNKKSNPSEIAGAEFPDSIRENEENLENGNDGNSNYGERIVDIATLHELKKQKVVGSKDIASAVRRPVDNRVALPLGHNMVVAFSRSRLSTFMNKGGRPVVDALAKELVEDIFAWDGSST